MRLKKISMKGFKSFADRTDIFLDDGITIVVGPNGSGKSNISDAIRWVLGEMSLKVLRGSKMEDVIYKGSDTRRALGFAEVEIVLDNSDGSLPIEYSEVSISRRLYKSGESNYFINQNPCRQKDIRHLFMDTGVGKEGYSIIGQGRIDEILSEKPEDRRAIFEEVAGISKFKTKKEESKRKLEKTDESLIRINDIIFELENTYNETREEADKTRKYNELYQKLRDIDISLSLKEIDKTNFSMDKDKEELVELEDHLLSSNDQIKELEDKFEALKINLNTSKEKSEDIDRSLNSYIEDLNQLKIEREKLESNIKFHSFNMMNIQENLENKEVGLREIEDLLVSMIEDKGLIDLNLNDNLESLNEVEKKINDLNPSLDRLTLEEEKLIKTFQELRLDIEALVKEREHLNTSLVGLVAKLKDLDDRIPDKEDRNNFLKSEARITDGSIKEIEFKLLNQREEVEKLDKRIRILEKECESEKESKHKFEIEVSKAESQLRTIKAMEDNLEGYQRSVKTIVKKYQSNSKLKGILSDLFTVQPKYAVALEVALAGALQNIVVEKDSDAKEMIEFLKKERAGRATFLPINRIRGFVGKNIPKNKEGVIGLASDLISFKEDYRNIFENLLGRTLILENMDYALSLNRESIKGLRLVTLEGEIFNSGGSITGGFTGEKGSGLLSRKNKINELEEIIKGHQGEIGEINQRLEIKNEIKERLQIEYRNKEEDIRIYKEERNILFNKKSELEKEIAILTSSLDSLIKERADFNGREVLLKRQIEDTSSKLIKEEEEYNRLKESIDEVKKDIGKETDIFKVLNEDRNSLNITKLNLENRLKNLEDKISEGKSKKKNTEKVLLDLKERKEKSHKENRQEIQRIEELKIEIENLSEKIKDKRVEKNIEKKRENEILDTYYQTQKELSELNKTYQELEKNKSDLEMKISRSYLKNEGIRERIEREYGFKLGVDELMQDLDMSQATANKAIRNLREELSDLGSINPIAIEREIELGNRLELMKSQQADLIISKEDLKKIIADIEEEMSLMFKDTIATVNVLFNEVYRDLFNGGEAELRLKDEEDFLNSGVEILITPEGKKRQAISLLSGGEKALTAIALLFAIQRIKPSPFCILDEIDAALDDQNIDRFTKYLTLKLNDIQFIIVTHRKKTMEIGDIIYGVSMMEDGVSTLLSVKLK